MAELAGLAFDDLKAKGEATMGKELGKYNPLLPTVKRKEHSIRRLIMRLCIRSSFRMQTDNFAD